MTQDAKALAARFAPDFTWGVATAAYQIEGATRTDGRGPSVWDAFANMPGRVYRGHNGDVACDHYNRWEADLDLIAELGVGAYRFSIAWPRILPQGRGAVNVAGLDFYDRLIDGLVARGIGVFPTLYHWDLPLALAGYGGWTDRDTADAFADYTTHVVRRLGDRIDALATFNEPWCSTYLGHWIGKHAPGERSIDAALAAVHVTNLAHGLGVQAARAERSDLPMGTVLNAQSIYPATDSADDAAAAERAFQFNNGVFFDPIFRGSYPDQVMAALGDRLQLHDGDLEVIHQPLDWWGFNYYFPATVKHAPSTAEAGGLTGVGAMGAYESDRDAAAAFLQLTSIPSSDSDLRTDIGWEIVPEGIGHLLHQVYARYDLPPCYVTENGACYNMGPGADGTVEDQPRIDYIAAHLEVLADAADAGIPLRGYFAWSLMDNYEWAEGYRMRFGIVHVDYDTQTRTVKRSGQWFARIAGGSGG
ncbi:family 1 glycosylhydrolase [Jannaschia marina]|uniref:family 1 glycosylhydrolase n=1 Tax=Jannaschia marina TaxID=2741674 RepID=UPI0015CEB8B4|nr:family 1 glycosylhydrolase [Jannaschia marina]